MYVQLCHGVPIQELTRQEMIEYQIKTREFDGYKHYGQLPDLDGGILCLDFPVFAKAKVRVFECFVVQP